MLLYESSLPCSISAVATQAWRMAGLGVEGGLLMRIFAVTQLLQLAKRQQQRVRPFVQDRLVVPRRPVALDEIIRDGRVVGGRVGKRGGGQPVPQRQRQAARLPPEFVDNGRILGGAR